MIKLTIILLSSLTFITGCIHSKKDDTNNDDTNNIEEKTILLNDTIVVSENNTNIINNHFICNGTHFEAIQIQADNILIKNNLFENCDIGIKIQKSDHIQVTGNRFENIGAGVILNGEVNDASVVYNEFKNIGERDCRRAIGGNNCNVIAARELSTNSIFAYNLIDNQNSNSIFMEDYISIFTGYTAKSSHISINNNLLIGTSLKNASNYSGACIVIDGRSANNSISNNQCYNVSGYGIAVASGSQSTIQNNRVYITKEHHDSIKRDSSEISHVFAFGATSFYNNICCSDINFINNEGYAYHDAYSNYVKVAWMPCLEAGDKNSYPDGTYANNITLRGNDFKTNDPQWEIPKNIFSNLGKEYYTGNHELKQ